MGIADAMARNEIVIDAPPEQVYETLLDPSAYPQWVVGAKQLRAVDRKWPRPGARFHHKVGAGPVTLADSTKLLEKKANRRVVLEVRVRPVGTGKVALDLKPKRRGRRTKVVMTEDLTRGPASWVRRPIRSAAIWARNAVSLRRLRRLVASRAGSR
jgi:uncharacterized protein YndB with AHSA1/START domain